MNRIPGYIDFVNEAIDPKGKASKLIVLSNKSEESKSIPAIIKEGKRSGLQVRVIDVNSFSIKPLKKNGFVIDDSSKEPMKISSFDTVVLARAAVTRNTKTMSLVGLLEDEGFFVVNSLQSSLSCKNKYITSKILMDKGIPVPKMSLVGNVEQIDDAVKEIGGQYPVVVKLLSGTQGIGVFIVDSEASLKSVLQTIWKVDPDAEVLVQEKIESSFDLRIHVLTKKLDSTSALDSEVIGAMQRNRVKKDFRTNYSLGGTVQKVKITDEQKDIAIAAAKAVGCHWCGVDLIVDAKTKKNYVLEINSSPGTKGITEATGINIVRVIIDFLIDKRNWVSAKKTMAGFRECIDVAGIGHMVAKLDTGNGSAACSISYDKMEKPKDGKISWSIGKKEFTHKIVGYTNTEVGQDVHKRPIIELDVTMGKRTFRKVRVALTDRKEKSTKFLINRKLLMEMGCTVDPTKTFIVSTKPEGYNAFQSKGDPYGGISFHEEESEEE